MCPKPREFDADIEEIGESEMLFGQSDGNFLRLKPRLIGSKICTISARSRAAPARTVVGDSDGRMMVDGGWWMVVVVNNLLVSRPTSVPRRSINLRINEPAALSAREYFCVIRTGARALVTNKRA